MPAKTNKFLNWPSLPAAMLVAVLPAQVFASCNAQGAPRASLDRSWVKIDRNIYSARAGKIVQTRFNSNELTVLADHGFTFFSSFSLSPDVQYIAYKGYKDGQFSSYLYDLKHGKEYKLPIDYDRAIYLKQAKYFPPDPQFEFSPDSKMLAWPVIDPLRNLQEIVIMNLENQTPQVRPYPLDVRTLGEYRMTSAKWSPDGKYIYLESIAHPLGAYYKYEVGRNKFTRIEGHDGRFIENGSELPYYEPPCSRWSCAEQDKAMAGESATIDKNYRLSIKTADGRVVTVDQGALTPCGVPTIRQMAWLDNGKYYAYQLDGIAYIYGIKEHRKAALFDASDPPEYFGWASR